MAYYRFLTDRDYDAIATEEHMRQLIREVPQRIPQAEARAEMQLLEYLDQYYEIEKVLAVGKNIREYNVNVCYPGQVHIRKDEVIYKTLTHINACRRPTKTPYWAQVVDFVDPHLIDRAAKYSQLRTYAKGEVVRFGTEYWQCVTPHGYESGEVHMPGVTTWKEADVAEWAPNCEWEKDQVCSYNGQFYQYLGNEDEDVDEDNTGDNSSDEPDNSDTDKEEEVEEGDDSLTGEEDVETHSEAPEDKEDVEVKEEGDENDEGGETPSEPTNPDLPSEEIPLTPEEDEKWGLIGEYSEELEYDYSEEARDYVVFDDSVYYPILNPNADALEEGVNIIRDDPRNQNVVAHLSRIALYHLHSIISPTNISETRRWQYEDSITWLYNASKFKINPQLPRKKERGSCQPKVDWALETFQKDYNPNENAWLI